MNYFTLKLNNPEYNQQFNTLYYSTSKSLYLIILSAMQIVYSVHLINRLVNDFLVKEINWQVTYIILTFFSLIIC